MPLDSLHIAAEAWTQGARPVSLRAPEPMACASDRDAMIDALYEDGDSGPSSESDSHLHIERLEDGTPLQARFVYVDEPQCIGCTYCASIARHTFFMEEDHGRARVYNQGGDNLELVDEAIDSCPVNCIHFVSYEDLVILETERRGQRINNAARLRSQQECTSDAPPTKAKFFDGGSMRCNNCPGRGCKECPMFGVGLNPVYLERQANREERRQATGEAQEEEEQQRRDALISALYEADAEPPPLAAPDAASEGLDAILDALYAASDHEGDAEGR